MVSSLKNKKADSLTTGSVGKALVLFALPLLGSSLIQQLYNMVDLLFVGNVLGKGASAAVGSSSLLVTCLVGFFTGLSVGSGVIIARFYGGKDRSNLQEAVHTAMGVSLLGGIVLMLAGLNPLPVGIAMDAGPCSSFGRLCHLPADLFFQYAAADPLQYGFGDPPGCRGRETSHDLFSLWWRMQYRAGLAVPHGISLGDRRGCLGYGPFPDPFRRDGILASAPYKEGIPGNPAENPYT